MRVKNNYNFWLNDLVNKNVCSCEKLTALPNYVCYVQSFRSSFKTFLMLAQINKKVTKIRNSFISKHLIYLSNVIIISSIFLGYLRHIYI